jgi:hypothetical protein
MNPEVDDEPDSWLPFRPRDLVWHTIRSLLNAPEVDEVKRILGHAVIERNEVRLGDVVVLSGCQVAFPCVAGSALLVPASVSAHRNMQQGLNNEILALHEILGDLAAQNEEARVRSPSHARSNDPGRTPRTCLRCHHPRYNERHSPPHCVHIIYFPLCRRS